MAIAEGIAALQSLKSLYEIARDERNSSDPEKLRVAAAQMFDLALAAREQMAALQEERNAAVIELAAIKTKVEKMESFDAKSEDYVRQQTGLGGFVYVEKEPPNGQGTSPNFCAHCFGNRKRAILQPLGARQFKCPECGTQAKM